MGRQDHGNRLGYGRAAVVIMEQPECSIIVLNHNGKEYLEQCLSSVLAQDGPSFEVLLMDNGSSDGSAAFVRERFPDVRVIESKQNLGFAAGNNLAVEHVGSNLVVLLNNDTKVDGNWLRGLLEAVRPADVAAASSLVITQGYPARYYEKNGTLNLLGHNVMRAFEEPTDIFYAGGASLIYKKNLLGIPFDADYFAYGEDVYLGLRARFLGYQVKHTNDSHVLHYGGGSAKRRSPRFLTYYQERNRLLNILLFFTPWTLVRLIPFFCFNVVVKLSGALFARRWSLSGLLQSYLWFPAHFRRILAKRSDLKAEKRIPEDGIIALMSGKLANGENVPEKALNVVSLAYCRLVGLKTIELAGK